MLAKQTTALRPLANCIVLLIVFHYVGPSFGQETSTEISPYQRQLSGAAKLQVERLMRQIDDQNVRANLRQIIELRSREQGADHFETVDARLQLKRIEWFLSATAEQRNEAARADELIQTGHQRILNGSYDEAEDKLRKGVEIRERLFGRQSDQAASAKALLASSIQKQQKFGEAETIFRSAAEISEATLGQDHPRTGGCLHNLANCLMQQSKFSEAEAIIRRALGIRERVLGPSHPDTLDSKQSLSVALAQQDKLAEAKEVDAEILRNIKLQPPLDRARIFNNLGGTCFQTGNYAAAEEWFRKALAIFRQTQSEQTPEAAMTYNNLAMSLQEQGDYAVAEPLFRRALEIQVDVLPANHHEMAGTKSNLGTNLVKQSRPDEARGLLMQAANTFQEVFPEANDRTVLSFNNLAMGLYFLGEVELAKQWLDKAKREWAKTPGRNSILRDTIESNEIRMAFGIQPPGATAEAYVEIANKLLEAYGPRHPRLALACFNAGGMYYFAGDYQQAKRWQEEGLKVCRDVSTEGHPDTVGHYSNLAMTNFALRNDQVGEELLVAAARSFDSARLRTSFTGLGRVPFAAERSPYYLIAPLLARKGEPVAAWENLEKHLARGLWDDISTRSVRKLPPEEQARESVLFRQLQQLDDQLDRLANEHDAAANLPDAIAALMSKRNEVQTKLVELQHQVIQQYGVAAGKVYDLPRIQRHLPDNAALLTWVDFPRFLNRDPPEGEHWACIVRARGEPQWVKLAGSGADGVWTSADDEPARTLLDALRNGTLQWRSAAERLYQQRIGVLAPYLRGTADLPAASHLIVLPSPTLDGIPVSVLMDARPSDQPYYSTTYAPSGTIYAWLQERKEASARGAAPLTLSHLLVVGDCEYEEHLLPYSKPEVGQIDMLFSQGAAGHVTKLVRQRATAQALEELAAADQLREHHVIHFSTHGSADDRVSMRSALLLSDTNLPDPVAQALNGEPILQDKLTAERILRTWTLDAELVTLSSCESGLGRYGGGEGYLGFSQAFFLAGARSLVLSLWKVDDEATAMLMVRFYENLLGRREGLDRPLSKSAALCEAQNWLRNLGKDEYGEARQRVARGDTQDQPPVFEDLPRPFAHPRFWAGFILVGDPGSTSWTAEDFTVKAEDRGQPPGTVGLVMLLLTALVLGAMTIAILVLKARADNHLAA